MNSRSDIFKELSRLVSFGPGGDLVADEVGNKAPPVDGLSVGGVEIAVSWLLEGLVDAENQRVLFLIGAPGNGKSYWSRQLAEKSGLKVGVVGNKNRQYRKHTYADNDGEAKLEIVNDATALDSTNANSPTISDLAEAFDSGKTLLININRGVFYKEINQFNHREASDSKKVARAVFLELSGPKGSETLDSALGTIQSRDTTRNPHETLQALRIQRPGQKPTLVLAVQMDLHSIFVRSPNYVSDQKFFGVPITQEPGLGYRLISPNEKDFLSSEYWESTPGGHLVKQELKLLSECGAESLSDLNPVRANIYQMSHSIFFSGVVASLRSAEIVSSRHFAFRHLWTALYFLLLGDIRFEREVDSDEILRRFDKDASELSENVIERLRGLVRLAEYRFHQAIFGAKWAYGNTESVADQSVQVSGGGGISVLQFMAICDPTVDNLKQFASFGEKRVWSRGIRDAFVNALTEVDTNSIVELALKSSHSDKDVLQFLSKFDIELDRCVLEMLRADQGDKPLIDRAERDALLTWYGDYVTRLVSLSLCATAWSEEINEFVGASRDIAANPTHPALSDELHRKLLAYVLPQYEMDLDGRPRRLVTLLRSRTEPIRKLPTRPTLVYELPVDIKTIARARGDRVVVELIDIGPVWIGANGEKNVLFSLDLNVRLIRELNINAVSSDAFSEISPSIIPLVERYRALATNNVERWGLVTTRGVDPI